MWAAATSLLVLPAVLPPEIHPWSAAACHALAAGAAFLLAGRSGGTASSMGSSWVLLFLPFAAASVLAAACRARAVDQAAAAAVLVLAGFLGRAQAGGVPIRRLTSILAALGSGAALLALTQHFITYPRLAAALRALDPADPTGALIRLEAGRPSGPFILPTALGGFLAMTLPASLVRAFGARTGATRAVAALAALLQILALGLSRSIGALGAATVGALLVLPALAPRRRGAAAAALVLLAGLCAAIVLGARRGEILARPGGDPVSLRAGNWGAAVRMIGEHPLFGVGPGSFGTFYPRQMRPGMNETRYAHNSYLQAMAAWGLWIAVPLGALIAAAVRSTRRCRRRSGDRLPLLAGGVAFLVHNLVDFTAYLPGVAIPASLALGAGMGDAPEKG
ncbi:MAG: O-antigen ligase family protein, partial [Planctomycetota bacterium]